VGDALSGNGETRGVRAALSDLLPVLIPGAGFDAESDEVVVRVDDGRARVAVSSLATTAEGLTQDQWPQLIEIWCAGVLEQLRRPTPEVAVDDLRVRLVPRTVVAGEQLIVRPYGAYFQLELMADLSDRRVWVGPARAGALGLEPDAAFAQGLRNTITTVLATLDVREHDVGNGLTISMVARDDTPWVSTGLTSVQNLFRRPELPHGAIVAVPRLSTVLFTPVESDRVLADVLLLGRLVADMHRDGTDPCSPDVFWFHDRALYRIERGDGSRVTLPVELEPVVAGLPKA
jgi:hypothetical protein